MSTPTQPAVTQPYEEEADRSADDHDTIAETRPLPEAETVEVTGSGRPELLPSIGHIGRYALKYKIGEGGLGTVFAAHDPLLSRLIAIKTLHLDLPQADREQFNALFLNEAKAAGSLNHPHIVTMYDAGTSEQGTTYIAMELLRGKDLRQLLAMGWKPTPAQSALIVRRVADALSYAHHKGVIHRDIKPANIFMVGRTQPRVLDFGIARIRQAESLAQRDDPQSRFQEIVGGSPYYMAPEQVRRQAVDRRVDVYALGVVLYELLAFKRAFSGNSLEEIADTVLNQSVPLVHELNRDVPVKLSEIVARAMHRDPEQRTRSARRLSSELREWLDSVDGDQAADASRRMAKMPRVGKPGLWSIAAAGWAAVALGVGLTLWQGRGAGGGGHAGDQPAQQGKPAGAEVAVDTGPAALASTSASTSAPGAAVSASQPSGTAPAVVSAVPAPSPAAPPSVTSSATPPATPSTPLATTADVGAKAHAAAASAQKASSASATAPNTTPAAPAAPANGVLKLAINPWGEVLVDGRSVGTAPPLHQLSLPPGQHVITVRNGDAPDFRQTIEVRSDKAVYVKHQF